MKLLKTMEDKLFLKSKDSVSYAIKLVTIVASFTTDKKTVLANYAKMVASILVCSRRVASMVSQKEFIKELLLEVSSILINLVVFAKSLTKTEKLDTLFMMKAKVNTSRTRKLKNITQARKRHLR